MQRTAAKFQLEYHKHSSPVCRKSAFVDSVMETHWDKLPAEVKNAWNMKRNSHLWETTFYGHRPWKDVTKEVKSFEDYLTLCKKERPYEDDYGSLVYPHQLVYQTEEGIIYYHGSKLSWYRTDYEDKPKRKRTKKSEA